MVNSGALRVSPRVVIHFAGARTVTEEPCGSAVTERICLARRTVIPSGSNQ